MKYDAFDSIADAAPMLCDDSLGAELGALVEKAKTYRVALTTAGILMFVSSIANIHYFVAGMPERRGCMSVALWTFWISTAIAPTFRIRLKHLNKRIRLLVGESMTKEELGKVFEVASFDPGGAIKDIKCHFARLPFNYDRFSGSCHVVGTHRGVQFEFSNIDLTIVHDAGKRKERETSVFRGQWLIVTLAKTAKSRVVVSSLYSDSNNTVSASGYNGKVFVNMENEAFNVRFIVIADDTITAFYVLTPAIIEYIIEVDQMVDARTHFCFESNHLHIFLGTRYESFQAGKDAYNIPALRTRIQSEARSLADFLDMLMRNDRLFRHEQWRVWFCVSHARLEPPSHFTI